MGKNLLFYGKYCVFCRFEGKGIRANDKPVEVTNSYITNDMKITGNKINDLITYDGGETDLFKDPSQYDFTIIDGSFAGKTNRY